MERRNKAALMTLTTAALALAATMSTAAAKSGPPSPTTGNAYATPGLTPAVSKQMADQAPLSQAADRIYGLADKDAGSGFAAVSLDTPNRAITVRWKGAVPAAVAAELGRDRARGIAVTIVAARYSVKESLTEATRLGSAVIGVKASNGDTITTIGPNDDYSGLVATLAPGAAATAAEKQAVLALSPEALMVRARAEFPGLSSTMPITVTPGEVLTPLSSRQADTAPYYAGGQLQGGSGSQKIGCTTGFSATLGTSSGLLTAAHCTWTNWSTGAGVSIGRTSSITYSYDEQFIPTSAAPDVWDGPSIASPNGAGQFFKPSYATGRMAIGEILCVSGAWGGAACGNDVIAGPDVAGVTQPDGSTKNATLWELFNSAGDGVVGNGDSGGPVFGLMNNNSEDVDYGLISSGALQANAPCIGMQTFGSGTRRCAFRFWVSSAVDGAAAMGASIFTY
ncbi:hypothetical protein ABH920_004665 [Catenulispora sp. EB89]|uniref:hypothetical protein n=1 Tax=Catenulispora sp. EB89 TaxID=3156257 RepID=UPI003518F393